MYCAEEENGHKSYIYMQTPFRIILQAIFDTANKCRPRFTRTYHVLPRLFMKNEMKKNVHFVIKATFYQKVPESPEFTPKLNFEV